MTKHYFSLLVLGDETVTGETNAVHHSFPYRLLSQLRNNGLHVHAPELVAGNGWTSFELADHLIHLPLNEKYDFVLIAVGLHNIIRDASENDFKNDLDFLIKKALRLTDDNASHVMLLSIPLIAEYSSKAKDSRKLNIAIKVFNKAIEEVATAHRISFTDINNCEAVQFEEIYNCWAERIAEKMKEEMKK